MAELWQALREYGADIEGVMERFLQDKELYESCFASFLEDEGFQTLKQAIEQKNYAEAFEVAHMLKGVAANLGLIPLYEALCNLVEPLRRKEFEGIFELSQSVEKEYLRLRAMG